MSANTSHVRVFVSRGNQKFLVTYQTRDKNWICIADPMTNQVQDEGQLFMQLNYATFMIFFLLCYQSRFEPYRDSRSDAFIFYSDHLCIQIALTIQFR